MKKMAKRFRILLDAGHGAGSRHNRGGIHFNEGDNNYRYSLVLKRELEKIPGVTVDLVRTSIGQDPSTAARAARGNGYDLFLSLHSNAAGASVRGTEIFDSVERPNKALAQKLVNAISKAFNHNNRGVKYKKNSSGTNWYGVLRNNRARSAMIIEHGFHTNSADSLFFRDNHARLAKITADIIRSHYGLSGGTSTPSTPSTGTGGMVWYGKGSQFNTVSAIKKLQSDLMRLGENLGRYGADGSFGDSTENAVKSFQRKHGLSIDGRAGTATRNKISAELAKLNKPVSKDLYRIRKSWSDVQSQKGAYASLESAINLAKKHAGYKVYDSRGTQLYPKEAPKPETPPVTADLYRVRSTWANEKTQKGAFKSLENAVDECKKHKGYHVYDATGRQVYPIAKVEPLFRVRKSWGNIKSQIGAYSELENALELARKNKGYRVYDANGKIIPVVDIPAPPTAKPEEKPEAPKPETKPEKPKPAENDIPIMGDSVATAKQMEKFLLKSNPKPKINITPLEFATIFLEEGEAEGVRGDIAFCQAMKETGWLSYGGQVLPEQHNYAGIGATNNSAVGKGNWFDTERLGIRAQIQHLKAYGSKEPLVNENIDPRFKYVTRGVAPNWIDLNGRWAVPGAGYGQEILEMYVSLIEVTIDEDEQSKEEDSTAEYIKQIDELKKELKKALSTIEQVRKTVEE